MRNSIALITAAAAILAIFVVGGIAPRETSVPARAPAVLEPPVGAAALPLPFVENGTLRWVSHEEIARLPSPTEPRPLRAATVTNEDPQARLAAQVSELEKPMDIAAIGKSEFADAPLTPVEKNKLTLPKEVTGQANKLLQQAEMLGDRGALFSARNQFLRVLRMVCQSLDARIGRSYHTRCLARGLQALEEADDFGSRSEYIESDVHLGGFISGHQTPVLHDVNPEKLTSLNAMRHYYDYAHEQLRRAGAGSPIASKALFALGRAETLINANQAQGAIGPKPLAFYNAALAVDPTNAQAANELGVALARSGHVKHAINVLQRSSDVSPSAIALQNLAQLYSELGDQQTAMRVAARRQQLAQQGALRPTAGASPNRFAWVDPATFNDTASAVESVSHAAAIAKQPTHNPARQTTRPVTPRPGAVRAATHPRPAEVAPSNWW
jgi:tetratricopeptide (TPR) repeat protein